VTGNNERKLPAIAIRFTLRSLLGLMLLVGVYFAGRASMTPSLEAEKRRVMEVRQSARAEVEKYEELQRQLQQQILREQQLRPFIEAEEHNQREMQERLRLLDYLEDKQDKWRRLREEFEIELQGPE
jgi:hypothetical protein